ncbi:MAG TPA: DUF2784 domain-containing protein [Longimicrobium sp.]|jgi:hypothetical protein
MISPAAYRALADTVVLVHLAFVLWVVLGGLAALRWPRLAWAHLPAAAWGAAIEFAGWICPLTYLENHLRLLGGGAAYRGGFVDRYILHILYPQGLTRGTQVVLGIVVLAINGYVYSRLLARRRAPRLSGARSAG